MKKEFVKIICGSLEELGYELIKKNIPLKNTSNILSHEEEHFNAAKKVGKNAISSYSAKIFMKNGRPTSVLSFTHIDIDYNRRKEIVKIALAPEQPSKIDYWLAKSFGWDGKK